MSAQVLRVISIICASQLAVIGLATAVGDSGFNSGRAFAAAFWGMEWAMVTAALIVLDHEARGKGK